MVESWKKSLYSSVKTINLAGATWFAKLNKQLLPLKAKMAVWGEATQVLFFYQNYYADKKYLMKNTDEYGNILILKDSSSFS